MPLGPYSDFKSCVEGLMKKGKSKESATKICGWLEQHATHKKKMSAEEEKQVFDAIMSDE